MAKNNTALGCGTLLVLAIVLGGCMKLVGAVFGTDDDTASATETSAPIRLPDWRKQPLIQAENEAEALGLEVTTDGLVSDYCSDKTDCFVYRMVPTPGTVMKAGGQVAMKFMTSEERSFYGKHRKMPNVIGWSEDRTDKLFEPVYWLMDSSRKETNSIPEGAHRILAQSPKPGKPLRVGQKIKLVIGFNYGSSTSTRTGNTNVDVDSNHRSGESRFCSSRWWC